MEQNMEGTKHVPGWNGRAQKRFERERIRNRTSGMAQDGTAQDLELHRWNGTRMNGTGVTVHPGVHSGHVQVR